MAQFGVGGLLAQETLFGGLNFSERSGLEVVASEPGRRLHMSGPLEENQSPRSAKKGKKPRGRGWRGSGTCPKGQGVGSALSHISEQ